MERVRFGKTELLVSRIAFGGIPIQRLGFDEAAGIVRKAVDLGVNFIDTANGYTDSEEKIGAAIKDIPRDELVITSKSAAQDKKTFLEHVDLSLKHLGIDYIDLYQLHYIRTPEDHHVRMGEGGAYEGLMESIKAGKVRFPAFSSHSVQLGIDVMKKGKFDAVQLPFNYIDDSAADEAIPLARELDMGFIAMKPFGGGMLCDAELAIKYLSQFDNIVPDPGIEKLSEIEEIVRIAESSEGFSAADAEAVERVRKEVGDTWCHRCNYCQPCPQNINISTVLTIESFTKRLTYKGIMNIAGQTMETARKCTECRECTTKCPYNLDIPVLIKNNLVLWDKYVLENA